MPAFINRTIVDPEAYGPLSDLRVSIKDVFNIAGQQTTLNSPLRRQAPVATEHAQVVQAIINSGGEIIGRTTMDELALGGLGVHSRTMVPPNPVDATRVPGGSSSGAAVSVATGQADIAIASDTSGSGRVPAAFCGVVGFKPTAHWVSRRGMLKLATSLDSVAIMANSVDLVHRTFECISKYTRPEGWTMPTRIVVPRELLESASPEQQADLQRAVEHLKYQSFQVDTIAVPELQEHDSIADPIFLYEFYRAWRPLIDTNPEKFTRRSRWALQAGQRITETAYQQAVTRRQQWQQLIQERTNSAIMLTPTTPTPAPLLPMETYTESNKLALSYTKYANLLDGTAISVPSTQVPTTGLMLTGHKDQDLEVLLLGQILENLA